MKLTELLYSFSRWLMALLFIFSGVAKSLNPFGLSIQLSEYFAAFGFNSLRELAGVGAVILPSLELLLGLMIVMNLSRLIAAWGVLLSMLFFTGLTLWIALENPVSDCGCFGDLLKLTNWETFIKNIILLPFAVIYFIERRYGESSQWRWYFVVAPLSFALAVYSTFNLPLVDATPFKEGVNVLEAMSVPDGEAKDEVKTVLIYRDKVSGVQREFEIGDTEWQDESKWEYVDTKVEVLSEGYKPAIKSLPMINRLGEDVAKDVLSYSGEIVLVVTNYPERIDFGALSEIVMREGSRGVLLTSGSLDGLSQVEGFEFYNSDYSVINTMIQYGDGGVLIVKNGIILDKMKVSDFAD